MTANFQRPSSLALCIFSILWVIAAAWFTTSFVLRGNWLGAIVMALFGLAALGLWFQSRVAAWTLIAFASVGTVFGLLSIGHTPWLRIATRVCWAIWSVTLLVEFLKSDASS
jgi:hypothetical protein